MRSRSATRRPGDPPRGCPWVSASIRLSLLWLLLAASSLFTTAAADPSARLGTNLSPSATRIALAGKSTIYRSYGLVRDPEFYAPLGRTLEGAGVQVTINDREVEARCDGRTARWRLIEIAPGQGAGEGAIPAPSGEEPSALRVRDAIFLPVRAAAALLDQAAVWDEATRTLHLVPQVRRVEVTEGAEGLRLHLGASGPVRATPLMLRNPLRLVVDLSPAVLQLPDGMPAARGAVKTIRAGQFGSMTVRVVLEAEGRLSVSSLSTAPASEFAAPLALQPNASRRMIAQAPQDPASATEADEGSPGPGARGATDRRPPGIGNREPGTEHRASSTGRRRTQRLSSRGGYFRRDPKLLDELLRNGQAVLAGKVICVDPGHGGSDPGARGVNGLLEKDACLAMAEEVARALRDAGAAVILTREDDRFVSLDERIDFANSQGCDLFISIHCNSMPHRNTASGTETYYYTPQSAELAQSIHAAVAGHVAGRDGGVRGNRRFAVIRRTTMPSVLVEVAYINHQGDEAKLGDPEFRRGLGDAIRDGVITYFGGG